MTATKNFRNRIISIGDRFTNEVVNSLDYFGGKKAVLGYMAGIGSVALVGLASGKIPSTQIQSDTTMSTYAQVEKTGNGMLYVEGNDTVRARGIDLDGDGKFDRIILSQPGTETRFSYYEPLARKDGAFALWEGRLRKRK